jgi:hypothetical protein
MGETGSEPAPTTEELTLTLLESGRPDLFFALIPEIPLNTEAYYHLRLNGAEVTPTLSFKPIATATAEVTPLTTECLINLDAPDPKLPVSRRDDRAPEAGIQRIYQVSVYVSRDRVIDMDESASLSGLVTLDWLTVSSDTPHEGGTLLTLRGGQARSAPITAPLGEQKLLIRALTERGARCRAVIEFTSF